MHRSLRALTIPLLGSLSMACSSASSSGETQDEAATMDGIGDGQNPPAALQPVAGSAAESIESEPEGFASDDDGSSAAPSPASPGPVAPGGAAPSPAAGTPVAGIPSPTEATDPASGALPSTTPAAVDGEIAIDPTPAPAAPTQVQPGTLTAGTWDDNQNFERFMNYREELLASQMLGLMPIETSEHEASHQLAEAALAPRETLDISLVIDTTGSMGDELSYLQSEFTALSESIEAEYPNAAQRWSLVLYRDEGDEYVTRWFDFREDLAEFRSKLGEQASGGGGDTPEAPDAAFEVMNQLAWRSGENTARLAFWVADAPHHEAQASALAEAVRTSQNLGIHVYPVASSGVDEVTELSMRSAAQLTFGRYIFLTNDSGVGGDHKEPSIPCYFVTALDDAILRMVEIEMSGVYREPTATEIIRKGGDPQNGACELASGSTVLAF